jgi:hypothetical protein
MATQAPDRRCCEVCAASDADRRTSDDADAAGKVREGSGGGVEGAYRALYGSVGS